MAVTLTFGVYPGGMGGGDQALLTGPPDDFERAARAVRNGSSSAVMTVFRIPKVRYGPPPRPMDLVLQFRSEAVVGILKTMRSTWMPSAGIPAREPIHIAEHGRPTSAGRTFHRQAEVIEQVIRTVHANSGQIAPSET